MLVGGMCLSVVCRGFSIQGLGVPESNPCCVSVFALWVVRDGGEQGCLCGRLCYLGCMILCVGVFV